MRITTRELELGVERLGASRDTYHPIRIVCFQRYNHAFAVPNAADPFTLVGRPQVGTAVRNILPTYVGIEYPLAGWDRDPEGRIDQAAMAQFGVSFIPIGRQFHVVDMLGPNGTAC